MRFLFLTAGSVMAVSLVLFLVNVVALAGPTPANGTAPNSEVEIEDGTIVSSHSVVNNDNGSYGFKFDWSMKVPEWCCGPDLEWWYAIEFWEDDVFSDDYVCDVVGFDIPCNWGLSHDNQTAWVWNTGTFFHDAMGSGSAWECEYYYDAGSACGTDSNYDPPDWQWEQPN
jgi:hypothetical protein